MHPRVTSGDALARDMKRLTEVLKACYEQGDPVLLAHLEFPRGAEHLLIPNDSDDYLVIGSAVSKLPCTLEVVAGYRSVFPVDSIQRHFHALIVEPGQRYGVQQRPFHPQNRDHEVRLFGWRLPSKRYAEIEKEVA
jgi:hypothetical protein